MCKREYARSHMHLSTKEAQHKRKPNITMETPFITLFFLYTSSLPFLSVSLSRAGARALLPLNLLPTFALSTPNKVSLHTMRARALSPMPYHIV